MDGPDPIQYRCTTILISGGRKLYRYDFDPVEDEAERPSDGGSPEPEGNLPEEGTSSE